MTSHGDKGEPAKGQAPRLAVLFPSTTEGGCERYALTIAGHAARRGWDAHLLFPQRPATESLRQVAAARGISYHPLEIHETGARSLRATCGHGMRLARTIRVLSRVRPDVCLLANPSVQYMRASMAACVLLGIPAVVCFQYIQEPYRFAPPSLGLYRWLRQRGQSWICVSEQNRDLAAASFKVDKSGIEVVRNGVDPAFAWEPAQRVKARARVRKELGMEDHHALFLTVAALRAQKGHASLLGAIRAMADEFPDARWLWVGDGPDRAALEEEVAAAGLATRVTLAGSRDDVRELLAGADFFVFPSRHEGFSFALLEAMAAGVPVIATRASSVPEAITHEKSGLLCHANDPGALAEAMRFAVGHPEAMNAMAEEALRSVERFDEATMAERTLAILRSLR